MRSGRTVLAWMAAAATVALTACGGLLPYVPTPADLVVERLSVTPAKAAPGDDVEVAFSVRNAGQTDAPRSTAQVRLGTDPDGASAADALLDELAVPALAAGSSRSFTISVTLPADATPGANYLWVVADALDEAEQVNRANDAAVHPVAVEYLACTDPAAQVTILDPNLEAAVRVALALPTGPITCADMADLEDLDAPDAGITRLDGLQHAINLTGVNLTDNDVADLAPLENLVQLEALWLYGNQVADLSPLEKLTALLGLSVENNRVSDIGPLVALTSLRSVWLGTNEIADLGPLQGLHDFEELYLWDNGLTDLAPLVANPGLGAGDTVDVSYNCLDTTPGSTAMTQIEALEGRGVDVVYTGQRECEP